MSTDENNCLSHSLLITLNNFKRISLNNTHTHRDHDGHGQECVKMVFILIKLCLQKNPTSTAPGPHTMLCCTRHLSAVRAVWSALRTQYTVNLEHSNALSTQCTRSNGHSALSATHLTGTECSVRASCVVPCGREPRR